MASPPALPGQPGESPIDRALTLWLAGENEAALRWACAALAAEPELPSALYVVAELLATFGRKDPARDGLEAAVIRAIDAGLLPLSIAAAVGLGNLGTSTDGARSYDLIADAFHAGSTRLDDDARVVPPPPPRHVEIQPLSSLLVGPALLNKAAEILRQAVTLLRDALKASPTPLVPRLPIFSKLSREGLRGMIAAFTTRILPAGGVVIEEGEIGTEAFLIARGDLEVRRASTGVVLARLPSGQLFGEMALVSRAPRAASVVALRPSLVLVASVERLEAVAAKTPDVGNMLATFCRERMLQNLVRTSPMLRAVQPSERVDLVKRFVTRTFEPGDVLIRRSEPPSGLHLIASGRVEVTAHEGGESFKLASLGPGEVVGEVAMILRRSSGADVVAIQPTVTLHLPSAGFHEMLRAHPTLLAQLYDLAIKRDEETSSVVAQEATSADEYVIV